MYDQAFVFSKCSVVSIFVGFPTVANSRLVVHKSMKKMASTSFVCESVSWIISFVGFLPLDVEFYWYSFI